jgi:hypothetical protein
MIFYTIFWISQVVKLGMKKSQMNYNLKRMKYYNVILSDPVGIKL